MNFLEHNFILVTGLLLEHIQITFETVTFSLMIGFPLGLLLARRPWLRGPVLDILGFIYTIPSLALFVVLIPIFGLGLTPTIIALVAYAQFMLVRNWVVGLTSLDKTILEAATGMGMNSWQRFWKVEFILASPYLISGIRLAALSSIAIGMVAAYISAGGLGVLLFEGVITANYQKIITGAVASSLLAVGVNYLLRFIEYRVELRLR